MEEKRTKPKITNEEALTELIKNTFAELEIKKNVFEKIEVTRKNVKRKVVFGFRDHRNDSSTYCDERLANHLCLSFDWQEEPPYQGGGQLKVADDKDLTPQIIDFIDMHLDHPKRRNEVNEQLSLF